MTTSGYTCNYIYKYGLTSDILSAKYENYTERMNAVVDWLLNKAKNTEMINNEENAGNKTGIGNTINYTEMVAQWEMVKESITNLTEEDYCFISKYNPPVGHGFMFDNNPEINQIGNKVSASYQGHSGASYGWTMRFIEYVVKFV